jgi:isopenicillin-N epimerase
MTYSQSSLSDLFLLDPKIIFLNHGSFGACPKPVFEAYQQWQLELERQPVFFLGRRVDEVLDEARRSLADYLQADSDHLVFVPNATIGINTVARSLKFQPGDEILTTNHEYGAMDMTWKFICQKTGAKYIRYDVPLPVTTTEDFVESFWSAVTPRTRVIFLSHITSSTALRFPVEPICQRARAAGILTVIDGAHAPGQIPLNLSALGADFYVGNCHKWLCAPKGSGFLYARPEYHAWFEPLVISWGWDWSASFIQRNQWQGTRDVAAFLAVPAAIEFQASHQWEEVRTRCHKLVCMARQQFAKLTQLPPISPDSQDWFIQMAALPIPPCDGEKLKRQLYDEYQIEIPFMPWNGGHYLRISCQAYNTLQQVDALIEAVKHLLPLCIT